MNSTSTKVSVGLSTVFGLSASTAAFIAAVVAAASGDRTPETLGAIGAGVVTGAAVIVSRGRQAVAHTEAARVAHNVLGELHASPISQDPITAALSNGTVTGNLTVSIAPPAEPNGPVA